MRILRKNECRKVSFSCYFLVNQRFLSTVGQNHSELVVTEFNFESWLREDWMPENVQIEYGGLLVTTPFNV
jgi:hypothetical protein